MLCSMDGRTGKHSANGRITNAQRTTVPIGGIEELFLSGVLLLLSVTEE